MKEYIAIEHQTENGGYIEIVSELIRCKDCKNRKKNKFCLKIMKYKEDDGYCDEAERREENGK